MLELKREDGYVQVTITGKTILVDEYLKYTPKAVYQLPPSFTTEEEVIAKLQERPNTVLGYKLSHDPIIEPQHTEAIHNHEITWKQLIDKQRLMYGDEPYIDDFGFYVYAYAELDFTGRVCKDLRYEENQTICMTESLSTETPRHTQDIVCAAGSNLHSGQ